MASDSSQSDERTWGKSNPEEEPRFGLAYQGDGFFHRVVVMTLALAALGALASSIHLAGLGKEMPQSIVALGSTAVGALAGVLITAKG